MSSNPSLTQQIEKMLQDKVPYTEIEEKCKVSSKTIASIAKDAGLTRRHRLSRGISPEKHQASNNPRVLENLRFLNEFFKANSEYLFSNPAIVDFIEKNAEKFTEVENLCQA